MQRHKKPGKVVWAIGVLVLMIAIVLIAVYALDKQSPSLPQEREEGQEQEPTNEQIRNSSQGTSPNQRQSLNKLRFVEAFEGERFTIPVGVRHAGDGSGRLFVVEKPGKIKVLGEADEGQGSRVYLDITDRVDSSGNEQGLLGLAFHPNFEQNGLFYVNYTTSDSTVIASYQASHSEANEADRASETVLLKFDQPFSNHNGGELAFGPDGYLYIAVGDGGSGGDPQGHGQNLQTLLGSILRIDIDSPTEGRGYGIPVDNPYALSSDGSREEIYAYGLRNPWRFSFDQATGALWAADVGQSRAEEINLIESGHNYGWNYMEGEACYGRNNTCDETGLTKPVWSYGPQGRGASVTGGYVYRGQSIPALQGKYLFADYVDGRIWALVYDGSAAQVEALELELAGITSFGEDESGEIYAAVMDGRIMRLDYGE